MTPGLFKQLFEAFNGPTILFGVQIIDQSLFFARRQAPAERGPRIVLADAIHLLQDRHIVSGLVFDVHPFY